MPQRLKTISLLLMFISVTSFCINKPIHPHKCSTTRLLTSFDSPSPPEPPPEPKLSIFEELVKVMEEKVEEDPDSPPMEVEDLQKQYSSTLESLTIDLKSDLQDTATSSLEALTKQLEDDAEARIQEGERKITPMIARVEKERKNVEEAAKQLQTLAEQNSQKTNKPIDRLLSFGSQPLYKQSSLALSLLFGWRGFGDIFLGVVFGTWLAADFDVSKDFGFAIFEFIVGAGFGLFYFFF